MTALEEYRRIINSAYGAQKQLYQHSLGKKFGLRLRQAVVHVNCSGTLFRFPLFLCILDIPEALFHSIAREDHQYFLQYAERARSNH